MTTWPDALPRLGRLVALRRLTALDLRAFQAYRHDPELGRYQGWAAQPDDEALAFLETMATASRFTPGEWLQIGIAERDSGRLIGDIGLCIRADAPCADVQSAEIGFTLARAAQGRGLATDAVQAAIEMVFAHTAVARVLGITDARNTASIRLLERVGMRRVASQQVVFRGETCTEHTHALERPAAL